MTKANNSRKASAAAIVAKQLVTCENCLHAILHRYDNDPLLAGCMKKPQPHDSRFPYVVEIARTPKRCISYDYDASPKQIEVRVKSYTL